MAGLGALPLAANNAGWQAFSQSTQLVAAARRQIGVTLDYDPAYVQIDYPGGDVPRESGVCIDVVIRAYRDAFGYDFQTSIHEDMRANFGRYPTNWGLSGPDRNIDHRRVPNLETWLVRNATELPPEDWQPGDLITCRVDRSLPHIAIVSDRKMSWGEPYVIHNIGLGTREERLIGRFENERRFRFFPAET
ncbi:DUF1287 domain-containing protein [Henriciella pelagia]|jgi:uncharacterized protein YijF (DUF1287 family)|uniref:DUF1287 domain-containing protein n=1 Tax=Henriciella pelagia TaxID=1977912 RepID=A0ABQ1J880_9PROT|nr:DUF1287 domain-containing protein [Henriciella pelagia]GGB60777.1 DUF1287 domain-containing protein [Henriciella pelagia]